MFKVTIKNESMIFESMASYQKYMKLVRSYSNTGIMLVVTIDEYSNSITNKQYSMFSALVIKGSEVSGYSYKEFEDQLIDNFASYKYQKSILGEMVKIRKKVSEMNHKEFNIFWEQCVQFVAEFYDIKF